jgi:hypothetical protein
MAKKFEIRNSTAEFLIFQIEGKESGAQVVYHDETRTRRMIVYHKREGRSDFFVTLALNKKRLYYVGRADE